MKRDKRYIDTRFSVEVLREALETLQKRAATANETVSPSRLCVEHDDSIWQYDNLDEFFTDYRRFSNESDFLFSGPKFSMSMYAFPRRASISVTAPTRADVLAICEVFERHASTSKLPPAATPDAASPVVFIGHGRNPAWRDLKDHLQDKHGFRAIAYETGARAGHTIRDILEEMIQESSFAVLVMTGEDEQADGNLRARQNVIHEAGLFQGKLGFARAIILLEEGVEEFSNVQGIQYIRFSKENIKETFGEIIATLRREFE